MARPRYKSGPKKGKFMSNRAIAAQKAARKKKRARPKKSAGKRRRPRRKTVAKRKTRRRRSRGKYTSPTERAKLAAAAVGLGYAETEGYLAQLPGAQTVGQGTKGYAALGVVAHVLSKKLKSKWADRVATASFNIAGYKFGQQKFQMQGAGDGVGFDEAMDADEAEVAGIVQ